MALTQLITTYITLKGDGVTSTFSFSIQNVPGASGIPSAVTIDNPPIVIVSTTIDKSGIITIVLASPLGNGELVSLQIELSYSASSGLALSSSQVVVNISSLGDTIVIPGVAGKTIQIRKLFLTCPIANQSVVVKIKDGAADSTSPPLLLGAVALDETATPWFTTTLGNDLIINLASPLQVTGKLYYTQG